MSAIALINSRSRREYVKKIGRIAKEYAEVKKELEGAGEQLLFLNDNLRTYSLYETRREYQAFCIGDDLGVVIPNIQDFRSNIRKQADEFTSRRNELNNDIDRALAALEISKIACTNPTQTRLEKILKGVVIGLSVITVIPALVIVYSDVVERQNQAISLAFINGDLNDIKKRKNALIKSAEESGELIWTRFLKEFPPNIDLAQVNIQY